MRIEDEEAITPRPSLRENLESSTTPPVTVKITQVTDDIPLFITDNTNSTTKKKGNEEQDYEPLLHYIYMKKLQEHIEANAENNT
jgi:hypothetical protein